MWATRFQKHCLYGTWFAFLKACSLELTCLIRILFIPAWSDMKLFPCDSWAFRWLWPSQAHVSSYVCFGFCSKFLSLAVFLFSKRCVLPAECHFSLAAGLTPPGSTISTPIGESMQETIPPCPSISRKTATWHYLWGKFFIQVWFVLSFA